MNLLIAGLLLFFAVHLVPVFPGFRGALVAKLKPNGYKGVFSLLSIAAVVLIVYGLTAVPFQLFYEPPGWGRHAAMLLMLPALYLFFSNSVGPAPSSAKAFTAHPMTWGVVLWSVGHLLANGDLAHVFLFSTFLLSSLASIASGHSRKLSPALKQRPALAKELAFVLVVIVVYIALLWSHTYFTGMRLIGN